MFNIEHFAHDVELLRPDSWTQLIYVHWHVTYKDQKLQPFVDTLE